MEAKILILAALAISVFFAIDDWHASTPEIQHARENPKGAVDVSTGATAAIGVVLALILALIGVVALMGEGG